MSKKDKQIYRSKQQVDIKHIIIQASGPGTRMGHLTANKPKALVSINGKPLIFHIMDKFPNAKFVILGMYKKDIFKKYLDKYCKYNYTFIGHNNLGNCGGMKMALSKIPANTPFMITWCDLYFSSDKLFIDKIDVSHYNYVGISNNLFRCRYSLKNGWINETPSKRYGIAGIYIFKNKNQIKDVPTKGEFCNFLKDEKISVKEVRLQHVKELGVLNVFKKFSRTFPTVRPFNTVKIFTKRVIKRPKDAQGKELATKEKLWYKNTERFNFGFVPKVYKYNPLTMQRINGKSVHKYKLKKEQKNNILNKIVSNLKTLHSSFDPVVGDFGLNDREAIVDKTKARLDSIINLIPKQNSNYFMINGKRCLNFYKKWEIIEKEAEKYHPKEYKLLHGDHTFSNTLLDERTYNPVMIDPRGYYGKVLMYGDEDYDWAKLYYSIVGNYDQFNQKDFRLKIRGSDIQLVINSNGWDSLGSYYLDLIGRNKEKILFFHAIIWLSFASYAWDDYDSICGAFYNGLRYMQEYFDILNEK